MNGNHKLRTVIAYCMITCNTEHLQGNIRFKILIIQFEVERLNYFIYFVVVKVMLCIILMILTVTPQMHLALCLLDYRQVIECYCLKAKVNQAVINC